MSRSRSLWAVIALFLAGGIVSSGAALNGPSDRDVAGLVGLVKSVDSEEAFIELKKGKLAEGAKLPLESVSYDRAGRKTESFLTWMDIGKRSTRECTFDYSEGPSGRVVVKNRCEPATTRPGKSDETVSTFEFDPAQNMLDARHYMADQPRPMALTQRMQYYFDAQDRVKEERIWGFPEEKIEKMLRQRGLDPMFVIDRSVFQFGDQRHPTEERIYEVDHLTRIVRYTYGEVDAKENWVKRSSELTFVDSPEKTPVRRVVYRKIRYY